MTENKLVIGVDYGTDSCRAILVCAENGKEIASSIQYYPRWKSGLYCNPIKNIYRQHPSDYIETLEKAIKEILTGLSPKDIENIVGISFDMTGSTPALVDENGTPLALLPEFNDNPNAMFMLWKDHSALQEAQEINQLAHAWHTDYTAYSGMNYSSEWVWAKVLHTLRIDEEIRKKSYSWVEHCDWIPSLLTGNTKPETMIRSRCAAGHKAMWHESWNGLPSDEFLTTLSPLLKGYREHLYTHTYTSDIQIGYLSPEWAERLGLHTRVAIGGGALDCHMGAVGAGIKAGAYVRVIGTSTCDVMVIPKDDDMSNKIITGIAGQVDGSVLPHYIGLEAGQSAFGDIYAWFRSILEFPLKNILSNNNFVDRETLDRLIEDTLSKIIPVLTEEAEKLDDTSLLATDWFNGRRTPDMNQYLTGTITGLTLGTTAPHIFKSLVEATAFGSKAIFERFKENGIVINEVIGIGGISIKSPFVMQTLADVLGCPIKVAKTEQACALGSAMYAAVIGNVYSCIEEAQRNMGQGYLYEYFPKKEKQKYYEEKYLRYKKMDNL